MAAFIRISQNIAALASIWFSLCFVIVALCSLHYPYPLEWMEGLSIDVVQRVLEGKHIYVEPTLEYVPFIYPPLYFYISALAASWLGVDFFAARLVSLLAAIGVGFLLFHWVRREGGDKKTSLISAGLFYSTYALSARWFDVARIDSLYIFLLLAGLYALVHGRSIGASVMAALLFTAAFFTKQNLVIVVVPVLLVGLWTARAHSLRTAAIFIALSTAIFLTANHVSDGWLKYYTLDLPASHSVDKRYILGFWLNDMLRKVWPLILVAVAGLYYMLRTDPRKGLTYLSLLAGLVGAAYMGRLHRYGWTNVLISAHLGLALYASIAMLQWMRLGMSRILLAALVLVIVQMGLLVYNPGRLVPTERAQEAGDAFLHKLSVLPGDIFMPEIQFVPTRVGKKSYGFGMPAIDVLQSRISSRDEVRQKFYNEFIDALRSHRFAGIIYSGMVGRREIDAYYIPVQKIPFPNEVVAGYKPRQYWLLRPRTSPRSLPAPR